jgi:WD40 repeat protein
MLQPLLICGLPSYTQDNTQQINSIDFHRTADLLVTASHDDMLYIYDTAQGTQLTHVPSKKYGAQNVVWTHSTEHLLFASNKVCSKHTRAVAGLAVYRKSTSSRSRSRSMQRVLV